MRTTVDIDDSVLLAAKAIARDEGTSLGVVVSRLARIGMQQGAVMRATSGFPVFTPVASAAPITIDLVNEHRDE